jgi:hypothetical protein
MNKWKTSYSNFNFYTYNISHAMNFLIDMRFYFKSSIDERFNFFNSKKDLSPRDSKFVFDLIDLYLNYLEKNARIFKYKELTFGRCKMNMIVF